MRYTMRQAKREITDTEEIARILQASDVCHLGLADNGEPYVVPLNYGFCWQEGELTLYFHCAVAGRKLDIIQQNSRAFFQMDCDHELKTAATACGYSMNYACIMGAGQIEIVQDPAERAFGLQTIMRHYTVSAASGSADGVSAASGSVDGVNDSNEHLCSFDPASLAKTVVLRLRASEWSGKALRK